MKNHEQELFGLRYSTTAWEGDSPDPFHEEVGYWLWDPKEKQVLRSFIVPRGVTVLAGGKSHSDAKSFILKAERGSKTYGICSNQFLDREFQTVSYKLKVTIHDGQSFSYEEDSVLKIKGQKKLFHHRDQNTLAKISE